MPGNEVGDRVHNFFDQGSLSQDQRHSQFVAPNWPGFNNNIWNASERQINGPVNTGPENYNSQQSDIERGQVNQFSLGANGLNFARQNLRPEFVKSPSQLPQLNLNGFINTSQAGHMRQNEANFLGVDTEPDRRNITSWNPIPESQQRSGPHLTNSANFGGSESPMNFNFFGGQHQVNGQQSGMMQSLPRQQPGINDAQLQQQFILKQMELQRLQQLQNQSPINGNMLRETPNYLWPSQVNVGNMNWQQRGMNSSMPGYSNGFMISPEQGQAMQFMGLIPQQTSQSLYGVPVSSSRNSNAFPGNQIPPPNSAFSGNQYNTLADQDGVKEGHMVPRYGSEGNSSFDQASSQRLGNVVNLGGSGQGFGGGGTELVTEKYPPQASSQDVSTEAAVGLDPTEEKILFGSDDNIWEAFGGSSLGGSGDATDLLNNFPSMQSGTWSALMQSAVAETTSIDGGGGGGGVQEEWSGLGSQNSRPQSGSQHNMTENSQGASVGSRLGSSDLNVRNSNTNTNSNSNSNVNYVNSSGQQQQFSNQSRDYPQTESQKRMEGNSNSSRDFSRIDSGFWGNQQSFIGSVPSNGGMASNNQDNLLDKDRRMQMGMVPNSNIKIWKDNTGPPGLSNMKVNLDSTQSLPDNHHLDLWKSVGTSGKSGFESSGGAQHNLNKGLPILESSNNNTDGGATEIHEAENGDRRESSSDSHRNNFPPNRSSISRKFQYHPMGDVDVNLDSSFPGKQVLHSQPMSQNLSAGGQSQGQGQEANPNFLGSLSANIRDMGRASNSHGPVNLSRGVQSGGSHSGYLHNMSAPFGPSGEISSSNQPMSPSQNMLELFNKVDQSKDQNSTSRLSSSEYNRLSDTSVGGVAGPSQSQLSASHGFSLQLAPPSQGIALSNLSESVHNSSRTVGSPSTGPIPSEKGDKTHSWLASMSSPQCLPPHQPTQMDSGMLGNMDADVSVANSKDNPCISSLKSAPQSEQLTTPGGKIIGNQSATLTSDGQSEQVNDSQRQAVMSHHPVSNSRGNLLTGREMSQPGVRSMMQQMPDSFHTVMAGMSRKDNLSHLGNIWASQQHLLGSQGSNVSDLLRSQFQPPNDATITSFPHQKRDEQDGRKKVDPLSSQGITGEETQSEPSPSCSGINQKDNTPFHHLANQNNAPHNYSLLRQTQTTKNLGSDLSSDPTHRESKRLKGEGDGLKPITGQGVGPVTSTMNSMARDPQKFPAENVVGSRTDHTGISPQMAPSWFEQYGTFKNEQIQLAHNVGPRQPIKNVEQQLISGNRPNEVGEFAITCQTENTYTGNDHLSSLYSSMRPKKRKTATSDLLPWNKEIGQCLKRLQNLSSAEVDWAHSSNRLIEKVDEETDNSEDLLSMTRPKRRLLLTTQLVQQVFQPPSQAILSLDASSNYEVILYSLARSVLGDACSLTCGVESNSQAESGNILGEKVKTSESIQDQYFSKVVEDFVSREKELENELLRLDKHASILDFRLECQDLERFSVINRFARFHGRGQVDGPETSSSSDANATLLKPSPQRYVSAHPMPRNVPDRVHCLSL